MQQFSLHGKVAVGDLSVFASEEAFWPCNYTELPSSWYEHVPFAYWVTRALAPDCLVELGTHFGLSYLSFCEAIDRLGLPTTAYAVDTWQGDEHAGFYGQEVYDKLAQLHDPHFSRFSRLVRATFDEAVGQFADGSIDLLHIDGLHTYEAVKHDFETWRPKLASSAVVLFHDSNVRERNFGVWKLWQELAASHPHFEFLHGHGLGVLESGPVSLLRLPRCLPQARHRGWGSRSVTCSPGWAGWCRSKPRWDMPLPISLPRSARATRGSPVWRRRSARAMRGSSVWRTWWALAMRGSSAWRGGGRPRCADYQFRGCDRHP